MRKKSLDNYESITGTSFRIRVSRFGRCPKFQACVAYDLTKKLDRSTNISRLSAQVIRGGRQTMTCRVSFERSILSVARRSFFTRGLQNSAKENEDCVLTSFSLLRKRVTCQTSWRRTRLPLLFFGFSCSCLPGRLSPVRANYRSARSIGERNNAGGSVFLSLSSLYFFSRACRLRSFAKDRWRSG